MCLQKHDYFDRIENMRVKKTKHSLEKKAKVPPAEWLEFIEI